MSESNTKQIDLTNRAEHAVDTEMSHKASVETSLDAARTSACATMQYWWLGIDDLRDQVAVYVR